jgi:hypothetical protein
VKIVLTGEAAAYESRKSGERWSRKCQRLFKLKCIAAMR